VRIRVSLTRVSRALRKGNAVVAMTDRALSEEEEVLWDREDAASTVVM